MGSFLSKHMSKSRFNTQAPNDSDMKDMPLTKTMTGSGGPHAHKEGHEPKKKKGFLEKTGLDEYVPKSFGGKADYSGGIRSRGQGGYNEVTSPGFQGDGGRKKNNKVKFNNKTNKYEKITPAKKKMGV